MPLDFKRGVKKVASEPVFRCRSDDLPPARTHVGLRKLNTELLSSGPFGYANSTPNFFPRAPLAR
ncbi:MAG: hypothetical protein GKR87_14275 [Kiritimatiellae bacterium]|nr:hypothetical protein [Kiritimatiellia bacterium]